MLQPTQAVPRLASTLNGPGVDLVRRELRGSVEETRETGGKIDQLGEHRERREKGGLRGEKDDEKGKRTHPRPR